MATSNKDALCQAWLKFTQWFLRRRFISFRCIFTFSLLYPLEKGCGLSFEQTWIHPKILCAEFGRNCPVVLEKQIFYIRQCISLFRNYLPVVKSVSLFFNELESPFTHGWFVPSMVEIGPVIPEKMKMWELRSLQTEGQTNGRRAIKKAYLNCQLRWAIKNQQQQNKHAHGPYCWTANLRNISWSETSLSKTMIMHACWFQEEK